MGNQASCWSSSPAPRLVVDPVEVELQRNPLIAVGEVRDQAEVQQPVIGVIDVKTPESSRLPKLLQFDDDWSPKSARTEVSSARKTPTSLLPSLSADDGVKPFWLLGVPTPPAAGERSLSTEPGSPGKLARRATVDFFSPTLQDRKVRGDNSICGSDTAESPIRPIQAGSHFLLDTPMWATLQTVGQLRDLYAANFPSLLPAHDLPQPTLITV
jgi:hypothetical protein